MSTAPTPPTEPTAEQQRYAEALRGLLARGGFERTGKTEETRAWRTEHIAAYLDRHLRPDRRRTVHIAGSKGKGSTAAMVEALLRAAGARTLLLASPDVHTARERVAIDGQPLGAGAFADIAERLLADPETEGWSYFELLTMLGWIAGAEAACDWQVIEVGLGGRLDTTNAMQAKDVAVITPIDYEHTAILGETIPEIAGEKAGIIVGPCAVVTAPMRDAALGVIADRAQAMDATLHAIPRECTMRIGAHDRHGLRLDLRTPDRAYPGLRLAMAGAHQAENAATAVRAAELACAAEGRALPPAAVYEALATLRLPARFEVIEALPTTDGEAPAGGPLYIIDAMHTPLAARRFGETVRQIDPPGRHVYVLGLLEGKDVGAIVDAFLPPGATVIVTSPDSVRAQETAPIVRACTDRGASVTTAGDVATAVARARELAGRQGTVLIVGSLYTASEAREALLGITGDRALGLR